MDQEFINVCAKYLKIEDLPNDELQILAEEIGIEAMVKMILCFSGVSIYIPKDMKKNLKKIYVINTYNGNNAKRLSLKLDISERSLYDWVSEENAKRRKKKLSFSSQS